MVVAAKLVEDPALLVLQNAANGVGFVVAAFFELRFGVGLGVLASLLQVRKQFFDVTSLQNLLSDREVIGPEKLREIGLRVVQEETFFVEPKLTEVPELV